eukprot:SAG31_NODE_962_length_10731_cov_4.198552_4_plen_162_part_00
MALTSVHRSPESSRFLHLRGPSSCRYWLALRLNKSRAPIGGIHAIQQCLAFVQDTRLWHAGAANHSRHDRHAVVLRYAPWWLTVAEFGGAHTSFRTAAYSSYLHSACNTALRAPIRCRPLSDNHPARSVRADETGSATPLSPCERMHFLRICSTACESTSL